MKVIFSLNNVKESFAFCPGDVFFAMWVIGNGQFFNIGLICINLFIAKTFSDQCKLLQVIELFKVMKTFGFRQVILQEFPWSMCKESLFFDTVDCVCNETEKGVKIKITIHFSAKKGWDVMNKDNDRYTW